MNKPSLVKIVGQHVELRQIGRQHHGLCPLHREKTPSFTVNEDKGVFYCHGCHEGGDVIDFVMKLNGLSFPKACKSLGIENGWMCAAPILTGTRKRAAEVASAWVNVQRAKFNVMIAEAMAHRDDADEIGDFELAEIFDRELILLRGFYDALGHPSGAVEMLAGRAMIEQITAGERGRYES